MGTEAMQRLLSSMFQDWLAQHPGWAWLCAHPLGTLVLLGCGIFLFWGLLRAIARLAESTWTFILRLPLWLLQQLWVGLLSIGRLLWRWGAPTRANIVEVIEPSALSPPVLPSDPVAARLQFLIERLEQLQQEQQSVVQEVRGLLAERSLSEQPLATLSSAPPDMPPPPKSAQINVLNAFVSQSLQQESASQNR